MIFDQTPVDRKVRVFALNQSFLDEFVGHQPAWGPVGHFTFKRTYARPTCDCDDPTVCAHQSEEFWQTCKRVVEGVYNIQKLHCRRLSLPWNEPKAQQSAQDMFRRMWEFKFTPPGRGLWTMGTDFLMEKGGAAANNCAFVSSENIAEDFAGPFCFLMDMSMLGVGVGGDTRGAGKVKIGTPKTTDVPFVVEDSREGWVAMARALLNSFVGKGTFPTTIDFSKVRPRGKRIRGFGGIASGPAPLSKLAKSVTRLLIPQGVQVEFEETHHPETGEPASLQTVFRGQGASYRITSTNITDVFNMVGACVVAGGVRRSAEIMFGDPTDPAFRELKSAETLVPLQRAQGDLKTKLSFASGENARELQAACDDLEDQIQAHPLMSHRWASNNSVFAEVGMDYKDIAARIAKNGEPGVFWLDNARKYGRMVDPANSKDWRAQGCNPCSEQTLESFELCCLVETYPAHHDTYEDFERTLKMAYLYAKTVTLLPTHDPRTNAVMNRNRRIGCSMSGIRQAIAKHGRREFLRWCEQGYQYIQKLDRIYSDWLGIPLSIKTTSVKPSGTVSLLCGATPGIHTAHSAFYIRNIRVAGTSPLVEEARRSGYKVEKDAYVDDTFVISFPVKTENFDKGKRDVSIWEQMALAADMQRYWADNQVSVTVTFRPDEAREIGTVLEVFEDRLKSVSFLPLNDSDHGYVQAPYIEIPEAEYLDMAARVRPMNLDSVRNEDEDKFCDGGVCAVKLG